ncbi:MAG: hypothetical protein KBC84_06610 [Proteobacteria bacterium]|nr:hypothetical protein [Pseudomonadota bacterium]
MKINKLIISAFIVFTSVNLTALIPPDNRPRVDSLLDKLETILDGSASETCDFSNNYENAYEWLADNDGLNLSQQEAERMLDKISDKSCPALYFNSFKSAYTYAFSKKGLDKNRQAAIKFATIMADNADKKQHTKRYLDCYKKSYAFQTNALKKPRLQAEQIAESQCLR